MRLEVPAAQIGAHLPGDLVGAGFTWQGQGGRGKVSHGEIQRVKSEGAEVGTGGPFPVREGVPPSIPGPEAAGASGGVADPLGGDTVKCFTASENSQSYGLA
ncbi:hypothetical protein GCM10008956_03590 [Deinococcus arenae]|uniref:Uncharacterized protein n=1 Tax=Deinococcus arenae TaxID=1452751 RepID=A0A8H9L518_9DEIO|nr:hypothetical protein GCM10008956_03590 [Deinococcus arenae]